MMVACHWKRSSPTGPALQFEGGSFCKSANSCSRAALGQHAGFDRLCTERFPARTYSRPPQAQYPTAALGPLQLSCCFP